MLDDKWISSRYLNIFHFAGALNNEFKARKKLNPVIQNIADILLSKVSVLRQMCEL